MSEPYRFSGENSTLNPEVTFLIQRSLRKLHQRLIEPYERTPTYKEWHRTFPTQLVIRAEDSLLQGFNLDHWDGAFYSFANAGPFLDQTESDCPITRSSLLIDFEPFKGYKHSLPEGTISVIDYNPGDREDHSLSQGQRYRFYVRGEGVSLVTESAGGLSDAKENIRQASQDDGQALLVDLTTLMNHIPDALGFDTILS